MAKSNGFLGKSCAGFAEGESAHGVRAWATEPARQRAGNGAAMWALALLGFGCTVGKTLVVFVLHFISH